MLQFTLCVTIPEVSSVKDFYYPQHFVFPYMVVIFSLQAIPSLDHPGAHIKIGESCQSNSQTPTTLYPLLMLDLFHLCTLSLSIWLCPQDNPW